MARNDPQMNLRVPMALKEKIEKAALDNGRTITAEAVYRLEESFTSFQEVEESQQKLVESQLELIKSTEQLQTAFKQGLLMQQQLIEQNKMLTDKIKTLRKPT